MREVEHSSIRPKYVDDVISINDKDPAPLSQLGFRKGRKIVFFVQLGQLPGYWVLAKLRPNSTYGSIYFFDLSCGYDPENDPVARKMTHFPVDSTRKMTQ